MNEEEIKNAVSEKNENELNEKYEKKFDELSRILNKIKKKAKQIHVKDHCPQHNVPLRFECIDYMIGSTHGEGKGCVKPLWYCPKCLRYYPKYGLPRGKTYKEMEISEKDKKELRGFGDKFKETAAEIRKIIREMRKKANTCKEEKETEKQKNMVEGCISRWKFTQKKDEDILRTKYRKR